MGRESEHPQDPDEALADGELRPSKSARKRAAHAAQALGEELVRLKREELEALHLPEELLAAILDAQRIKSRGGGARQRQYIGRLMREVDLAPIDTALQARRKRGAPSHAELAARQGHIQQPKTRDEIDD